MISNGIVVASHHNNGSASRRSIDSGKKNQVIVDLDEEENEG